MTDDILTPQQAADILQVSTKTLLRMCGRNEIAYALVSKQYRFRRSWVDAAMTPRNLDSETVSNLRPMTADTSDMARQAGQLRGGWAKTRSNRNAS